MAPENRMARNVALIPWFGFLRNLSFWQATWFLYFQSELSAAEAILLYVVYDIATTALEVPSGWMSDRLGRRLTLIASALAAVAGLGLLAFGSGFAVFVAAQVLLGAHAAFVSGTDSALLFESLAADGREAELEAQELRQWRFGFIALALSAVTGGLLAQIDATLPFVGSMIFMVLLAILTLAFSEPPRRDETPSDGDLLRLSTLRPAFLQPVLLWLFCLSVLMYGFSHVPFVFGQPFIEAALQGVGLASEAPVVSGAVTSVMMILSVLVSLVAPHLRARLGLGPLLLAAFAIQIGLAAVLAASNSPWVIVFLFLRMVPSSLSGPFILARIQPLLENETRATYLSLRSFGGRLLFALSLFIAAGSASNVGEMAFVEIQSILTWYALLGALFWLLLLLALRRARVDPVDVEGNA